MSNNLELKIVPQFEKETLHINAKRNAIKANINVASFVDKDTNQHIAYAPSLEISGYGNTQQQAEEMLLESVNSFFMQLLDLSIGQLNEMLKNYGWKKDRLRNKDFSKAFVDISGDLNNFNIEKDQIKRLSLVA